MLPSALFGTWFASSYTIGSFSRSTRFVFRSDGTCIHDFEVLNPEGGSPCTYSVGGADRPPSASAPWIVQMTFDKSKSAAHPLEIVALDAEALTTVVRFSNGELSYVTFARQ
jgi:hypothetical protein